MKRLSKRRVNNVLFSLAVAVLVNVQIAHGGTGESSVGTRDADELRVAAVRRSKVGMAGIDSTTLRRQPRVDVLETEIKRGMGFLDGTPMSLGAHVAPSAESRATSDMHLNMAVAHDCAIVSVGRVVAPSVSVDPVANGDGKFEAISSEQASLLCCFMADNDDAPPPAAAAAASEAGSSVSSEHKQPSLAFPPGIPRQFMMGGGTISASGSDARLPEAGTAGSTSLDMFPAEFQRSFGEEVTPSSLMTNSASAPQSYEASFDPSQPFTPAELDALTSAPPEVQKQMIGEKLYLLVKEKIEENKSATSTFSPKYFFEKIHPKIVFFLIEFEYFIIQN